MTGRAKLHLVNSVIFLVLTVLLNWFLIPRYGIIGAAVANMIYARIAEPHEGVSNLYGPQNSSAEPWFF